MKSVRGTYNYCRQKNFVNRTMAHFNQDFDSKFSFGKIIIKKGDIVFFDSTNKGDTLIPVFNRESEKVDAFISSNILLTEKNLLIKWK